MRPTMDAPQRRKAAKVAPLTTILKKEERFAERVTMIFEGKYEHLCLLAIRNLNHSEVFAEDMVADVFIDALTNWSAEKVQDIKDLEGYICKCVINRSRNFRLRNRRLIYLQEIPLDSLSTINPMIKLDLDLDGMTKLLPPKQREAFSLYCKGYTHKEIVQLLSLSSEGASKNLIYYAKQNLQKIWSELPEDDPDNPGTSGARSKGNKKAARQNNNKHLSTRTGNPPRVKDLLNYLNGNAQNEKVSNTILQWVIENKYAVEIISGLRYTLDNNIEKNIETRLTKGKASLRKRMLDIMDSKNALDKQTFLNVSPKTHLPFIIVNNKKDNLPIIRIVYDRNGSWIQLYEI